MAGGQDVTEPPDSPGESDRLTPAELRRRASAGIAIVASRGVVMLVLGFGGNVVLARLLVPKDFGLIAFGMTVVALAQVMSDGGLGAGLIRREEPPTRVELRAMLGLQLAATTLLAVVIGTSAALALGATGQVVAVMVASLPFIALQTPGKIVLERTLQYRPIAMVDIAQIAGYYAWAIPGVLAGFGVWALATGTVVRAVVASLLLIRLSRLGFMFPLFSPSRVRSLLGFGVRYQAANAVWVFRDQGLNVATAAIAGVSTLGLWTLARRILEVPLLLFDSLWRVSFPAMSQLRAQKQDLAAIVERGAGLAAVGSGALLATLAAASPGLVPGLFGPQWTQTAEVLPFACLALLAGGPISVVSVGLLYAHGRASTVLRATTVLAVVWLATGLSLLPYLGVAALGIGWLAGSLADALILGRATVAETGARLLAPIAVPTTLAVLAGATGWVVTSSGPANLWSAMAGGGTAIGLYLAGLSLTRRELLRDTYGFAARSVTSALRRTDKVAAMSTRPVGAGKAA
jgi:O-antigen/teichoic acid export membrane protein